MTTEGQLALPYSPVDPHSPIPLYHQVYLDLRQMIQREIILPGEMLPPEMDICQAYSVGRQTVRQAIARLVDEDLVERFAGRGTFVREQPNHIQFFLDRSFSQQMRELGRIPNSRLLSQRAGTVDLDVPALQAYQRQTLPDPGTLASRRFRTHLPPDQHDLERALPWHRRAGFCQPIPV